ncbi:hypothetical protein QBC34DRAFT_417887 [Podospora aff. communis PSN243]|uniref:Uncharacterized protein n=1 Tax=Podospora aff. communis PSN243 TaxID=3040156 RepID=A0AAV9G6B0_9PEZI|nr:hypothetical protein QBC34DRAFT_417887 [Podospora aff. communis PSN243]
MHLGLARAVDECRNLAVRTSVSPHHARRITPTFLLFLLFFRVVCAVLGALAVGSSQLRSSAEEGIDRIKLFLAGTVGVAFHFQASWQVQLPLSRLHNRRDSGRAAGFLSCKVNTHADSIADNYVDASLTQATHQSIVFTSVLAETQGASTRLGP